MMLYCRKSRVYLVVSPHPHPTPRTSEAQAEIIICFTDLFWVPLATGLCLILVS